MKVLLVKTSSLGDVVHTLPAATEALAQSADLEIDWLVEEKLRGIPESHSGITRVIPVAVRRWRTDWVSAWSEVKALKKQLNNSQYDLIIDSQGLVKSGLLTSFADGETHGFDRKSVRESAACVFYDHKHAVDKNQHAIYRQKQLLSLALDYCPAESIDFGLRSGSKKNDCIILIHGTTWPSKEWPETLWVELARQIRKDGFQVLVPSGNRFERERAIRILGGRSGLLDQFTLEKLIAQFQVCAGAVSVDTGLGHLASALGLPVVGLYGSTNPVLTGMRGSGAKTIASSSLSCVPCRKRECQFQKAPSSSNIYPPCFEETSPEEVWQTLQLQILSAGKRPA